MSKVCGMCEQNWENGRMVKDFIFNEEEQDDDDYEPMVKAVCFHCVDVIKDNYYK